MPCKNPNIAVVTSESLESEVIKSPVPVLMKLWATWCAASRALAPVIDEMADDYADTVKVVTVDVDQAPDIASRFRVRGVPTLLLFRDGKVIEQIIGAVPKTTVANMLKKTGIMGVAPVAEQPKPKAKTTAKKDDVALVAEALLKAHTGCRYQGAHDGECLWERGEKCAAHPQKRGCQYWVVCRCKGCKAARRLLGR